MVLDTHSLEALHELNYEGRKTYMHLLIMLAMSGLSNEEFFADDIEDSKDSDEEDREKRTYA